jgi:hypothetical protein
MRRWLPIVLAVVPLLSAAQSPVVAPSTPLVINNTVSVGLSQAQVMAAALDAWTYTFGQEPAARVERSDEAVIEGTARVNYRSSLVVAREETMGTVSYQVTIRADNGRCTVQVHALEHKGNRGAVNGGVDIGPIYQGDRPLVRVRGVGMNVAQRIHTDIRTQCQDRLSQVVDAFAARIRRAEGP